MASQLISNTNMKKYLPHVGIAVLIVVVIAIGYFAKPPHSRANITIGAPFILSGDFTTYGDQARNAVNLAVDDFKQAHPGVQVEVLFEDTHADAKQAVSAYRKLIDLNHVDAIVGPMLQTEMAAVEPMVRQDNVPVFSIAPVPMQDRGQSGNPIVLWPDPTHEAEQMATYIYDQGIRTIGILGTQDSWENEVSSAFAAKFKALGGTVTDSQLSLPDASDTRIQVTKVVSTRPQAIFLGTYYKFFDFVTEARQIGYKGKFYSIEIDTNLASQTKGFSDGLQFISPNFYTTDFVDRYEKKYGEKPTLPSGQAYDAAMLALKTLSENGGRNSVLTAMKNIKTYEGVSGTVTFDGAHRATFPLSIFEIQKGTITKIK
jgi:branched-chain amino acid transport system substrate-binding protein